MGTSIRKTFQGMLRKAESLFHVERNPGDPPVTSVFPSIPTGNPVHISDTYRKDYKRDLEYLAEHLTLGRDFLLIGLCNNKLSFI